MEEAGKHEKKKKKKKKHNNNDDEECKSPQSMQPVLLSDLMEIVLDYLLFPRAQQQ